MLYGFTTDPQHISDVELANYYTATHPNSPFVGKIVAMRKESQLRRRLIGRTLGFARPDGTTHERSLTDREIADTLRGDFGIALSPDEVDRLVSSLPTGNDESSSGGP